MSKVASLQTRASVVYKPLSSYLVGEEPNNCEAKLKYLGLEELYQDTNVAAAQEFVFQKLRLVRFGYLTKRPGYCYATYGLYFANLEVQVLVETEEKPSLATIEATSQEILRAVFTQEQIEALKPYVALDVLEILAPYKIDHPTPTKSTIPKGMFVIEDSKNEV